MELDEFVRMLIRDNKHHFGRELVFRGSMSGEEIDREMVRLEKNHTEQYRRIRELIEE